VFATQKKEKREMKWTATPTGSRVGWQSSSWVAQQIYDNNDNIYIIYTCIYILIYTCIYIYYIYYIYILCFAGSHHLIPNERSICRATSRFLPRWKTLWVGFQSQECLRAQHETLRPRCQAVSKSQAPEKWWTIFYHFLMVGVTIKHIKHQC
jgi:hypothetical protein